MAELDNPKCKKYFDKFLSLDKSEIIPFRVSLHILFCAKCRTAVRSMSIAEKLMQDKMEEGESPKKQPPKGKEEGKAHLSDPIVQAALRQIEEAGLIYPQFPVSGRVSLKKWIFGGAALTLCLAAFPFTAPAKWAFQMFQGKFLIPFYVMMGLAVAAYVAIFVGSNMDFFVKKIGGKRL